MSENVQIESKYKMRINLNVLNHLGINLYSNTAAVLSEVVANAWDANAEKVDITIREKEIIITDDGKGMSIEEMNDRYLNVGYEKRKEEGDVSQSPYERPYMGRKGIGKLSLFSIANTIKVESVQSNIKHGCIMAVEKIKKSISEDTDYIPDELSEKNLTLDNKIGEVDLKGHGTRITISDLKKGSHQVPRALRKRLARRFSIIGNNYKFSVFLNGDEISLEDRDYYHKIHYLWYFGNESKNYIDYCKNDKLEYCECRPNEIVVKHDDKEDKEYNLKGWIGTAIHSGDLKDEYDNLNKITILVRGKLAQEDILEDFAEGGLFSKYLIGEIHADFLDITGKIESATSNRQEIKKDDPRYISLKNFVYTELKHIQGIWTNLRKDKGVKEAIDIPAIQDWFHSLVGDDKNHAKKLFGKIGQLKIEEDKEKRELYKQSVLAFENMKYKRRLKDLDSISEENIEELTALIADFDEIEATKYYQIIKERIGVIEKLKDQVEINALEKTVQELLYNHLWLLDPSWDRITETPYMEQRVETAFESVNVKLNEDERKGRIDLRYKNSSGKHIIIELKRAKPSPIPSTSDILQQVDKYREALRKILKEIGKDREPIEVVCLIGRGLKDWTDETTIEESRRVLAPKGIRVLLYQEMIEEAYRAYNSFLEKNKETAKLAQIIERIEFEEYE